MKAIQLVAPGQLELIELAEPTLGPEEVLLEVAYVGLCGSDLNAYRGTSPMVTYPRIPGHEIAGTIAARGERVPAHFTIGQKATLSPYSNCGKCLACTTGRTNACRYNQTLGVQREGGLTTQLAIHHSKVYISDSLSLQELALVEPLSIGCHATVVAQVTQADQVAVFGCGAVGLGAISAAASQGAKVIVFDLDDGKLALAANFGASETINMTRADATARLEELADQEAVTVAIEAVGNPATYEAAVNLTATGGRIACIGYSEKPVVLDTRIIVKKELSMMGSRNARDEFGRVMRMLEQRNYPFSKMISRLYPFNDTAQAFADWSAAPGKFTKIMIQVA